MRIRDESRAALVDVFAQRGFNPYWMFVARKGGYYYFRDKMTAEYWRVSAEDMGSRKSSVQMCHTSAP